MGLREVSARRISVFCFAKGKSLTIIRVSQEHLVPSFLNTNHAMLDSPLSDLRR